MKRRAFLEKIGGEWLDDFVYMSKYPLIEREFEVIEFDGDDMENTLLNKVLNIDTDIIIGSVQATVKFFEACGVKVPEYLGYPDEMEFWYKRKIVKIKGSDLYKYEMPYFIKPAKDVKLFTGERITSDFQIQFLHEHYGLNDEMELYLSETIEIISEYRCFVRDGELKGIQYYSGDFKKFPNIILLEEMIRDYKSANCAYTLDVGVTKNFNPVLIEINDMWAIGSYGFNAREYVLMCIRRMNEIAKTHKL